jgi:hypothetical protein
MSTTLDLNNLIEKTNDKSLDLPNLSMSPKIAEDGTTLVQNNAQKIAKECYGNKEQTPTYGLSLLDNNPRVNDSARLYTNPFAELEFATDDGQPLYKSFLGRVEINLVARALVGAAFFTAGSYAVKQWQAGEDTWYTKPLQVIADGIDGSIGSAISGVLERFVDKDKVSDLMTFNKYVANPAMVEIAKENAMNGAREVLNSEVFSESLGRAAVSVTFAFAMGSTGATIGRNLALVADPNHRVSWIHDDHIDFGEMLKSSAKEGLRILAYNQMEDWFAAIPYLIQRKIIGNSMDSSGFGNLWELQNNYGNTHLVNNKSEIGGSYEVAGLADLQHRFPLYNFYTLIFRDGYNHIGHSFKDWRDDGFKVELPDNLLESSAHAASETAKYLTKSLIKSQLYMQPAMLFFSPANVAINKESHALMSEETKQFITTSPTYSFDPSNPDEMAKPFFQNGKTPAYAEIAVKVNDIKLGGEYYDVDGKINLDNLIGHKPYEHKSSPISGFMNPVGKFVNGYSNMLYDKIVTPALDKVGIDADSNPDVKWATNTFARAQTAYFPYMLMKYEVAQKLDTPDMDAAIYRAIDGASSFNLGEVGASLSDIGRLVTLQSPSAKTHEMSFMGRGLVNSTCEAKIKNERAQEKLKWREAEEHHLHEVSNNITPLQKLAGEIAHGDLKEIAEKQNTPVNNIVSAKGLRIEGKNLVQKPLDSELIKI